MATQIPANPDKIQKERPTVAVDEVDADDLVYSLEVKLIQSERDSFLDEGAIKAETSYNDRYSIFDSKKINGENRKKFTKLEKRDRRVA